MMRSRIKNWLKALYGKEPATYGKSTFRLKRAGTLRKGDFVDLRLIGRKGHGKITRITADQYGKVVFIMQPDPAKPEYCRARSRPDRYIPVLKAYIFDGVRVNVQI